jgi:hypothetical protein
MKGEATSDANVNPTLHFNIEINKGEATLDINLISTLVFYVELMSLYITLKQH